MATALPLPAQLTLATLPTALAPLRAQASLLLAQLPVGGCLHIDATALREVDTAGLAALLQLRRMAVSQGRQYRVQHPPEVLLSIARLSSAEPLLQGAA